MEIRRHAGWRLYRGPARRYSAPKLVTSSSLDIDRAVAALRDGRLVAFPTETVYGLGADATNASAVTRIFAVKGRPANHPLIVHIASAAELSRWAVDVPEAAHRLAAAFWPGPLTLLVRKSPAVPRTTTGGLETVGLRVPSHPVALELLQRFGGAVAAPSANRFGRVSPTRAEHVRADLGDEVDVLLDGGECGVGVESTIVDLTRGAPVLLRPGGVTTGELETLLGVSVDRHAPRDARAPGLLASHYAPRAEVALVPREALAERARELTAAGRRVAVLLPPGAGRDAFEPHPDLTLLDLGESDADMARALYSALRRADALRADTVLCAPPRAAGLGEALADRLSKAAGPRPPKN